MRKFIMSVGTFIVLFGATATVGILSYQMGVDDTKLERNQIRLISPIDTALTKRGDTVVIIRRKQS